MNRILRTFGVFSAMAVLAGCAKEYQKVETFVEADDPVALTAEQKAQWEDVDGKLNAAWGNSDFAYQRSVVPTEVSSEPFRMTVWKG